MQRVHSIWVYFTLEGVIQNGSILKSRGDQEVLGGKETQWLHLDQRGSDQEVLRGDGVHWSHLEQIGDMNEVLTCLANVTI